MGVSTIVLAESDVLQINKGDNVLAVSIQAPTSSTAQVVGNFPFKGIGGDTLSLASGEGLTLTAFNVMNTIDGITITAAVGSVNVVVQT